MLRYGLLALGFHCLALVILSLALLPATCRAALTLGKLSESALLDQILSCAVLGVTLLHPLFNFGRQLAPGCDPFL